MKKGRVGIDIGGTNTAIGIVDAQGEILALGNIPTPQQGSFEEYVADICIKVRELSDGVAELEGVGVGAPMACHYTGTIEHAGNMIWSGSLPLAALLEQGLGLPVVVTNDANAATLGEMIYGDAKGMRNFMLLTLGTGVGSGFVANGELIYGFDGFAGEAGHLIVKRDGRLCGCGKRGCMETYCSATGIVTTAHELLQKSDGKSLLAHGTITSKRIHEAACAGDAIALECFEITGTRLGQALADIVTVTAPEKIFLFGGLANAGDMIFNPIRRAFEADLMHIWRGKIEITTSGLQGKNIAILGAAALVTEIL